MMKITIILNCVLFLTFYIFPVLHFGVTMTLTYYSGKVFKISA